MQRRQLRKDVTFNCSPKGGRFWRHPVASQSIAPQDKHSSNGSADPPLYASCLITKWSNGCGGSPHGCSPLSQAR